jgi:hypothetical protein
MATAHPVKAGRSVLAFGLNAAEQKPFMSFFNPPSQPLPLEEHQSYESAAMKTKVGYNIYWEIPGIKHDLPRLSAWIGSDGLQFAVRHFGGGSKGE